jgi:hypothetical protein
LTATALLETARVERWDRFRDQGLQYGKGARGDQKIRDNQPAEDEENSGKY